MDHFASTAGGFVGKNRDWAGAMGATASPAVKAAPAATAAPAKAATGGSMDHFASTAGAFVGKDRDFKAAGGSTEAAWLGAGAAAAAPAAKAAPAKAATGGSMDHFASTAGAFVGKAREFKSAGGSTEAS